MTNNHTTIEFLFYFDTNKKYIRDEDYISILKSFSDISTLFCKDIFNIQNKIEVIVLPHEEGSFISKVGIFFLGAIVSGPISDASKGFLTGLIGKPLEVICQDYGVALKETIADFLRRKQTSLKQ